jgi:peptide/nickel transport system permease protein
MGTRGWIGSATTLLGSLLCTLLLFFSLLRALPGDPAELGVDGPAFAGSQSDRQAELLRLRRQLGLVTEDGHQVGIPGAFASWCGRMLRGDFGRSFQDGRPVRERILQALPATLLLNVLALVLVYGVGVGLGLRAALWPRAPSTAGIEGALHVSHAAPIYWLATLAVLWCGSAGLDLLPIGGLVSEGHERFTLFELLGDLAAHLVLPVLVLAAVQVATVARHLQQSAIEALRSPHVVAARAKGLPERVLVLRHVLRNALLPVVVLLGTLLPALVSGSVVVEQVFSIDGMGRLMLQAIGGRDHPLLMGVAVVSCTLTLVSMALAEGLLARLDPRRGLAPGSER